VVLNSGVVVDRNTHIEDSVILGHTYVGEQLNLKRCIVSGSHIIRVDEGVVVELTDNFMTAPLKEGVYSAHFAGPANQLFGLVASIIALPLMAVTLPAALWQNPYDPLVKRSWVSNRSGVRSANFNTFKTIELNVSNKALARLPQVLAVAAGHLRWFGVSPATESELQGRRELWEMTRDQCPAGVFGPAQLLSNQNTSLKDRFLRDAAYVPSAGWRTHLLVLKDAIHQLFAQQKSKPDASDGTS